MNRAYKLPAPPPHSDGWIVQATRRTHWQVDDSLDREFGVAPKGKPTVYRIAPPAINRKQTQWKTLCAKHFGPSHTVKNADKFIFSGENF